MTTRPSIFAVLLMMAAGCSDPEACGRGTHFDGARCVPDEGGDSDMDASSAADAASGHDAEVADAASSSDDGGGPDPDGGPNPPTFPPTIDRLSFAVETGGNRNDGSNSAYQLCLNGSRCFDLDVPSVDDFRRGDFDVYHFNDVDLPRSAVDRVELRHKSGDDAWRPSCVEVRFDGEPVHCSDGLTKFIGNGGGGGGGEVARWRDPDGLHDGCNTCYPSRVTHGPLVGAVGPDSARVWVRTDATRPVSLAVARASSPGEVLQVVGPRYPRPVDDYTTTFVIPDLAPRTRYIATVMIGDRETRKAARFRTAPRAGAQSAFRIALGSCSNNDTIRTPHQVFNTIGGKSPDLFLFLGDNHYGNTGNLQALWWNYRDVLSMPPRAALVASTPVLATWDDHDFTGNNSNRHAAGRDRSLRAFEDYWANPSYGTADQRGVFFRTSYGDVDLFMLDVRYARDRPGTGGSILGARQHAWLEAELMRSTATFKILASGSLFSRSGGETWTDYASRARLFRFIRDNDIGGVVFLAGDIHHSELRRIHRTHYDIPEIIASGLANVNPSGCGGGAPAEVDRVACHGNDRTFAVLDVDTTRADPRIIARLFGGDGTQRGTMTVLRSQLR